MDEPNARALFLDRDGVINVDTGYVHSREAFRFQDGIFELCEAAQAQGYQVVVVTNQAGIGRGYYSESTFLELTDWMVETFAHRQIRIARVYYCPYHPTDGVGPYKYDSPDRKPKPGMLLRAQRELNLDLASSVLVGDTLSDIRAAEAAGIGTKILLCSDGGQRQRGEGQCYVSPSLDDVRHRFFSDTKGTRE
jgi:D-glycero-D-manno-heptose 1,7-bisphosphate phosphatase